MTENQIDYLLTLLREKSKLLHEEHKAVLKSKHLGMNHVNAVISNMGMNNELIVQLEKMKKEADYGLLGLNH